MIPEISFMNGKLPVCWILPPAPFSSHGSAGHSGWTQAFCLSSPWIIKENAHNDCVINICTWFARRSERLDPWLISFLDLVSGMFMLANVCFTGSLRCFRECVSSEQQHRLVSQGFMCLPHIKSTLGIHVVIIVLWLCRTFETLEKDKLDRIFITILLFNKKKYSHICNSKLNLCRKYTIY